MSQFDCSRSSLLNYQFPPPVFHVGHTTGSTTSTWGLTWNRLYFWTPERIATEFIEYWESTVTPQDKAEPITHRPSIDLIIGQLSANVQLYPVRDESRIREIFDRGISWAHRIAISRDNNQRPPNDPHSTILLYQNVVFGEPDYLFVTQDSSAVKGVCEAKSPWNIGPSEIDDVISGANWK